MEPDGCAGQPLTASTSPTVLTISGLTGSSFQS